MSDRSAGVLGAAFAALIKHMGVSDVKIGLGGSLYCNHPLYETLLREWMQKLVPSSVQASVFFSAYFFVDSVFVLVGSCED